MGQPLTKPRPRIVSWLILVACLGVLAWVFVSRRSITVNRLAEMEIEAIAGGKLSPLYEHLMERDKVLLGNRRENLETLERSLGVAMEGWGLVGTLTRQDLAREQGVFTFSQTIQNGKAARAVDARVYDTEEGLRIGLNGAVTNWMMLRYIPKDVLSRTPSYSGHVSLLVSIAKHRSEFEAIGLTGIYNRYDPGAAVTPWADVTSYAWRVLRREGVSDEEVLAELKRAGIRNPVAPPKDLPPSARGGRPESPVGPPGQEPPR